VKTEKSGGHARFNSIGRNRETKAEERLAEGRRKPSTHIGKVQTRKHPFMDGEGFAIEEVLIRPTNPAGPRIKRKEGGKTKALSHFGRISRRLTTKATRISKRGLGKEKCMSHVGGGKEGRGHLSTTTFEYGGPKGK